MQYNGIHMNSSKLFSKLMKYEKHMNASVFYPKLNTETFWKGNPNGIICAGDVLN